MILLTYGSRTILAKRPNNLDYVSAIDLAIVELGLSGDAPITLLVNWRGRMAEVQVDTFPLVAAETDQIFVREEQSGAPTVFSEVTAALVQVAAIALTVGLGILVSPTQRHTRYAHLTGRARSDH
jgi:hypothetical protein